MDPGSAASGYPVPVSLLALAWASAMAGPFDTTDQVVLGQPAPIVLTWRPNQLLADGATPPTAACTISVTAEDEAPAAFNTGGCDPTVRPAVERALKGATARPVEELGWGLKTWSTVRVVIGPGPSGIAVALLPGGAGEVPELHATEVTVRERQDPIYPPDEKWRRVTGHCAIAVRVDTKGRPVTAETVRCTEGFEANSLAAVHQWRFKPHRVDGELTAFDTVLTLRYTLDPSPQHLDASP